MDKAEARLVLDSLLAPLRALPYGELAALVGHEPDAREVIGPRGGRYQSEVLAIWDDGAGGAVRVLASVFDDGWRSMFVPMSKAVLQLRGKLADQKD